MAYLEHLRGIKRRREVVPHRAELDLFLGGKKIECEERFDINREIQRLKAMAMPTRARDLFHGRGIVLPPSVLTALLCLSVCLCLFVCLPVSVSPCLLLSLCLSLSLSPSPLPCVNVCVCERERDGWVSDVCGG